MLLWQPLLAGKSNQKGATSLEEAIFFYTGTAVVTMWSVPFPATYCGGYGERFRCATRRGKACREVGMSVVRECLPRTPYGWPQKDCTATIAAAHCAAILCVSRRGGVCCGVGCVLTVRLRAPLPQGFAFVGDDALIVPPFGSHRHLCKSTAPAQRRCDRVRSSTSALCAL
ncbi:MAG: hypothetical protein LBO63_04580 [Oscillospiraceae bacterium]|nr:hypothetical protein [Oscillospiraceae bacterium]